jgi:hypothetical protein
LPVQTLYHLDCPFVLTLFAQGFDSSAASVDESDLSLADAVAPFDYLLSFSSISGSMDEPGALS